MGNREKVAGLVILCLVTIGLVHYLFFMDKAHTYRSAYEQYRTEIRQQGSAVSSDQAPRINKFVKQVEEMEDFLEPLALDLNIQWDSYFYATADRTTSQVVEACQDQLVQLINQVSQLRQAHPKLRLTFLDWGNGEGWDIPSELPSNLSPQLMWDHVEKLSVSAMMLKYLDNPIERMVKRMEYNADLLRLGVNAANVTVIRKHGELVPLVKRLAHARLIWERKEKDEKGAGIVIPIATVEDLYTVLEINIPENLEILFHGIKQFELLLKLIDLAEQHGVEDIRTVELLPLRKIDQIIEAIDGVPKPRLVPEIHFDQRQIFGGRLMGYERGYMSEEDMYEARYARPGPPGAVRPGMPGFGRRPGDSLEPTPTPPPQPIAGGMWMGNAVPIRVGFVAPYQTALSFLYVISHNRNPFEIDSLRITTMFGEGGKILSVATLAPMAWVQGLEVYYNPTTPTVTPPPPPTPRGPEPQYVVR